MAILFVIDKDWICGNLNVKYMLVEYSDFMCLYCVVLFLVL